PLWGGRRGFMIHIVFQQDDVQLLNEAIKLDETLQGEVFEIKDEWGVGPIKELDTDEGWAARQNWWREMLIGSPYGEKLVGTFDDSEILKNITTDWQKATRVLSNTLHRMKIKTGDVFLMWRMKQLISAGKIETMGNVDGGWKEFDVRKAGSPSENVEANNEAV